MTDESGGTSLTTAAADTASDVGSAVVATPLRPVDLSLARAHLRLGAVALARVELEILANRGALDDAGRVDLAEARWRTGDLGPAGEAATQALVSAAEQPVALVIAAEAAAALGRPNEARRLASRAIEAAGGPIDAIFAGMPRSAVWPADASEPPPTTATLFQETAPLQTRRSGDAETLAPAALRAPASVEAAATRLASTPGFWDMDGGGDTSDLVLPDPGDELDAARRALVAGSVDEAALRFALTLRLAPALAPAVLEATEGASGPSIELVRGDAFQLVGLETEARRAFAQAAWSGPRDRRRQGKPPSPPGPADADPGDTIPPVHRSRTQGQHARK